jgi:transposase-like protein
MGLRCPNAQCGGSGMNRGRSIIRYGFYKTKWGKRRRYRCQTCGKTFCSNAGSPYHRLQHRRATFDQVAALSVEGLNKSAIARVKPIAWNMVDRWLERAASSCRRFNDRKTVWSRMDWFRPKARFPLSLAPIRSRSCGCFVTSSWICCWPKIRSRRA